MSRPSDRPALPLAALAVACALAWTPVPARAEDCNELIRLGLYNVSYSVNQHDALVTAYHHICDEQYNASNSGSNKAKSLSLGFMNLNLGWGGSKGTSMSQESWKKVCEDSSLWDQYHSYTSTSTQQINSGTLAAWESCLAMTSRGLKTDIRPTANLTGISFDMYWTGSSTVKFQGIDQPDFGVADCTVTSATGTKGAVVTQPVTASTNFPLSGKAATVVCKRQMAALADGALWSDATRLTVKTTDGSFDIDLPPIGLRQVTTVEMDTLYDRIGAVEAVTRSAMPVSCAPPSWENKPWLPISPAYSGDLYKCSITVPRSGLLVLGLDGFIQGHSCNYSIAVDGKMGGTAAFTTVNGTMGESGHGALTTTVGPGAHVISVRGTRWRGSDQCFLGGGGITGVFLPQL